MIFAAPRFSSGGELNFDDFFGTFCAELDRHSDEESLDTVFAFEVNRTGQDFLFVLQDSFDHFHGRAEGA